jgi:O-antigen/teichoic acid export membrane protein
MRTGTMRHAVIVFGSQMTVNVLNYAFQLYCSRSLGVASYGVFWTLLSVVFIGAVPAVVLMTLGTRMVAEVTAAQDAGGIARAERAMRDAGIVSALAVALAAAAACVPGAMYLHVADPLLVFLTGITIAATFVLYAVRGVFVGEQSFWRYGVSTMFEAVGRLALGTGLILAGFGLRGAVGGYCAGTLAALALTLLLMPVRGRARHHLDVRRLLRAGLPIGASTAALTSLAFGDVILVKHYFSAADAGLYSVVGVSGKIVLFLLSFVPTLVLPKAAAARAASGNARPVLVRSTALVTLLALIVVAGYALLPQTVVRIVGGAQYLSAAALVPRYGFAMALLGITYVVVNYRVAVHDFRFAVPLVLTTAGELVAIGAAHARLDDVVSIVTVANALALLLVCIIRTRDRLPGPV